MQRSNLEGMLICDVAKDEDGYNYYGYLSSGEDSRYVIVRENTAETEYRYKFGKGSDYATAWDARSAATVKGLPNQLKGKN